MNKAAKSWETQTRAALVRTAKSLKIKGAARMRKSQLVWWLRRKCKKPGTVQRSKICKQGKQPIFSAIGLTVADLRKIAKGYRLKQSGKKATVAARIRSYLRKQRH